MSRLSEIEKLMKEHGFELVRTGKHSVWRDTRGGGTVITSVSPSCPRVLRNIKSDIKRIKGKCARTKLPKL